MTAQRDVAVIGAGIVGVSAALALQARGMSVRMLDRTGVAAGASAGNAGAFAFADIVPLATPGIMRKAPRWLLDPLGPLAVQPAYALNILPWLARFWRASWRDRYHASVAAQAQLMEHGRTALERQIADAGGERMMQRQGQLQLYEGAAEFRASLSGWQMRRNHGIGFDLLESPDAIAEIQPGLHSRFTHAAFIPSWFNTTDPKVWTDHLAQTFRDRGGKIEQMAVHAVQQSADGLRVVGEGRQIEASQVVITAGAHSHLLARALGDRIPLETERGYNTTLPPGAFDLRTHLTFGGHGFVVTAIGGGVRVGGAVELGGLHLPPNYRRADVLLDKASRFLPGLDTAGGTQWMGFRPSLPDSLPVIGRSPRVRRVIYAFGHGHLGLTQSAGTAELVAQIANGEETALSLDPYSLTRF